MAAKKRIKARAGKKEGLKNVKAQGKKFVMCRAFRHYGFALIGIGAAFYLLNFMYGATGFRIAIVAFFVVLGLADLLLYLKYGER